ncbi:DUF4097 family beta strand repeat-containing protein [Streptomyces sp. RPT161]|uniref:DUF4097 family beta strand repeat-containing protein n=1 Tax=Streptomyces sp. RPT161 TaxID=3015993 RepID=UPI0022B8F36C|nr:DUF4097 family beta strand repeat-containing protein [Streptomyces sp. RPT161]
MPDFATPEPVSVSLQFDIGTARITASERTDTVVEVLPGNGADDNDVRAAAQTKVSYSNGELLVKGPKKRSLFGTAGSLDISIELPSGSQVHADSPMADFICEGRLGDCRFKTSAGDIQIAEAGTVNLKTSHGDIVVHRAAGNAEVTGAGRIDIGEIAGEATVKNANGEITIGKVTGDVRANSSNGRISIGTAHAGVDARSAYGGIRVGEVAHGSVSLQTATGDLEVGIRESTAAWLDLNSRFGSVRNSLGPAEGPETSDATVEVRARTGLGDIIIRRA